MERPLDRLAHAAERPDVVARVAALLRTHWDPAAELVAPDGDRGTEAHARAALAILAAGGRQSEVVGYLRRAEEAALGAPRSHGGLRWALAEAILAAALGLPVPEPPGDAAT